MPVDVDTASPPLDAAPADAPVQADDTIDGAPRRWTRWHLAELLAAFLLGVAVMTFLYTQPGQSPKEWGVPGHDSFYHVKMAKLMPDIGLVARFPWLRATIFWHDRFVNHHWGFHALLIPFVKAARGMDREAYVGGRWLITLTFGATVATVYLLLIAGGVPLRWLWIGLFLAMPTQFFHRHAMVRAIDPSLLCMLLTLLLLFRRRYVAAGLMIAIYIQVYLGGVLYAPVIVACYVVATLITPRRAREAGWAGRAGWAGWTGWVVACTGIGWLLGILAHPYRDGVVPFLKLQVFGSGLTPDIPVGREWWSYPSVWDFASAGGPLWAVLGVAVLLRLLVGPRLETRDATLFLLNCVFLVLACKARRFIEYWPVFCLLTAAYLAAPLLRHFAPDVWTRTLPRQEPGGPRRLALATGAIAAAVIGWTVVDLPRLGVENVVAEWRLWLLVLAAFCLAPLGRWATAHSRTAGRDGAIWRPRLIAVVTAAAIVGVVGFALDLASRGMSVPRPLVRVPWWAWASVLATYVAGLGLGPRRRAGDRCDPPANSTCALLTIATTAAGYCLLLFLTVAAPMTERQKSVRCKFNLPAIARAMDYLTTNTPPGSIVFTDDWDIFPVCFYYNSHNHYLTGMDPKFTHEVDPVLWERYVRLSRGEFPQTTMVSRRGSTGAPVRTAVSVTIDDFVDHFAAEYVLVDQDHTPLARRLEQAPDFARRVWPTPGSVDDKTHPPYKIFRLTPPGRGLQPD